MDSLVVVGRVVSEPHPVLHLLVYCAKTAHPADYIFGDTEMDALLLRAKGETTPVGFEHTPKENTRTAQGHLQNTLRNH